MKAIKQKFMQFIRGEEGASATEYAVLIVLIIVVALAAIFSLGGEVRDGFNTVADAINDYRTNSGS